MDRDNVRVVTDPRPLPNLPLAPRGLSTRLFVLTAAFVMLGVLLIYAPTLSSYRLGYLNDRVDDADIVARALTAPPEKGAYEELQRAVLLGARSYGIVLRSPGAHALVLSLDKPHESAIEVDLAQQGLFLSIGDAFGTLFGDGRRMLRVVGPSPRNPNIRIETVIDEMPLRAEMIEFSHDMLAVAFVIALITSGLVFLTLRTLLVRPMERLTRSVTAFREDPENPSALVMPSERLDEIGRIERELAHMQESVLAALRQRARLAQLGAAMAKINHDLRNILASAQLVSDTVSMSDDPKVKRVAPTLLGAIDRAIALCSQTITFAAGGTQLPVKRSFALSRLVEEVFEVQAAGTTRKFTWSNGIDPAFMVVADRGQLDRVLTNLVRNAVEAGATAIGVEADVVGGVARIEAADDGPGLPPRALERLFQPFAGSTRPGGTGLGLAIARESARAHGGDVTLVETGAKGTRFRLSLPHAIVSAEADVALRPGRVGLRP
jgi:signal transduction histidine kinase